MKQRWRKLADGKVDFKLGKTKSYRQHRSYKAVLDCRAAPTCSVRACYIFRLKVIIIGGIERHKINQTTRLKQ